MRRLVLLSTLAVLLLAPSAGAAARVPFGFFGVSIDGAMFRTGIDMNREFGVMTRAGVESVITEVNWAFLQPHEDQAPNWGRIDRVVGNAAKRGIRVMANVLYAPSWAAVDPHNGASPPDPGKYAGFLRAAVLRYGTNGTFWSAHPTLPKLPVLDWQVWNEPPSKFYWSKQPFAARYVKTLQAARFGIKVTDANARVVLAGLTFKSWEDIGKIYDAGGKGLFDAVSLHPYTIKPANVKYIVKLVRRVMVAHGDGAVPVLITELSWPSAKGKTHDNNGHGFGYEVTPTQQKEKLSQVLPMLAEARRRLHIERVYWHDWASTDTGHHTFDYAGLRTVRGTSLQSKPALGAYRIGTLSLEGCRRKGATARRCG